MGIKREELLTKDLDICENCEWCIMQNDYPFCLLKNEIVGLVNTCDNVRRTGKHVSI